VHGVLEEAFKPFQGYFIITTMDIFSSGDTFGTALVPVGYGGLAGFARLFNTTWR